MKDRIDLLLRIVAFGLIGVAALMLLLKWIGVIHSPNFEDVIIAWLSGFNSSNVFDRKKVIKTY
jgi:hypothetical protein